MKIETAIIGASGYTGAELLRILAAHPAFRVTVATADSKAGMAVTELYRHLGSYNNLTLTSIGQVLDQVNGCDLVFAALPHGESMALLPQLKSRVIVDLGGDFRLSDKTEYEKWYGERHTAAAELGKWSYGLPELFRAEIKLSRRVANPGCYATAAALALAPLLKAGLIKSPLVVNGASGLSGVGRAPKYSAHLPHAYEDYRAYRAATHQHTPEMELNLSRFSGQAVTVSFTPHLLPMSRGILVTCYAPLSANVRELDLLGALQAAYGQERFVRITTEQPGTKEVRGSNLAAITARADERTGTAVITAAIDNLVKGAAGQAVQNANIIFGLDESTALDAVPLYP